MNCSAQVGFFDMRSFGDHRNAGCNRGRRRRFVLRDRGHIASGCNFSLRLSSYPGIPADLIACVDWLLRKATVYSHRKPVSLGFPAYLCRRRSQDQFRGLGKQGVRPFAVGAIGEIAIATLTLVLIYGTRTRSDCEPDVDGSLARARSDQSAEPGLPTMPSVLRRRRIGAFLLNRAQSRHLRRGHRRAELKRCSDPVGLSRMGAHDGGFPRWAITRNMFRTLPRCANTLSNSAAISRPTWLWPTREILDISSF